MQLGVKNRRIFQQPKKKRVGNEEEDRSFFYDINQL